MTARDCPICGEPAAPDYRPFCSPRCANVDLQRWLTGGYRLDRDEPEADLAAAVETDDEA